MALPHVTLPILRDAETWRRGDVKAWRRGDVETWRRGDVETWRRGDTDTIRYGYDTIRSPSPSRSSLAPAVNLTGECWVASFGGESLIELGLFPLAALLVGAGHFPCQGIVRHDSSYVNQ